MALLTMSWTTPHQSEIKENDPWCGHRQTWRKKLLNVDTSRFVSSWQILTVRVWIRLGCTSFYIWKLGQQLVALFERSGRCSLAKGSMLLRVSRQRITFSMLPVCFVLLCLVLQDVRAKHPCLPTASTVTIWTLATCQSKYISFISCHHGVLSE